MAISVDMCASQLFDFFKRAEQVALARIPNQIEVQPRPEPSTKDPRLIEIERRLSVLDDKDRDQLAAIISKMAKGLPS